MKLDVERDGNAVEVRFTYDLWMYPAGHGYTLAEALRQLADEVEEYNCNLTPKQLDQPAEEILRWMEKQVEAVYIQRGQKMP